MEKLVDINLALQYVGGYQFIHKKLTKSFLENYCNFVNNVRDYIASSDIYNLHLQVHSLKGICLNLGSVVLQDHCLIVLDDIRDNKIEQEHLEQLIVSFKQVYQELTTIY